MKQKHTVHVEDPPAFYQTGYFPREFHYRKEAVKCANMAIDKGAKNVWIVDHNGKKTVFKNDMGEMPTADHFGHEITRIKETILSVKWAVGYHDRGMGYGDFAVIIKNKADLKIGTDEVSLKAEETVFGGKGPLVVECGHHQQLAEHIVEMHNNFLKDSNNDRPGKTSTETTGSAGQGTTVP